MKKKNSRYLLRVPSYTSEETSDITFWQPSHFEGISNLMSLTIEVIRANFKDTVVRSVKLKPPLTFH